LFRLVKAGWTETPQFEEDTFGTICHYTQGIPRRINTLCDRVLVGGYLEELMTIDSEAISKVIFEIEEESAVMKNEFSVNSQATEIIKIDSDKSLEQRIITLEKIILNLQTTLNKERALLRKAILIQLDMDNVYNLDSD
jgi:hypothetical protein